MFWGFVLEPKKRYNTTVTKPFHISMAALDPKSINENDLSSLVLNVDGTETILCNLGKPNYLQERLDLNFIEGNTITLEVKGKATVHLSGYFIYEQDGMDDEDSDLDDEEDVDDDEELEADQKALQALRKKMNKKSKFNASTTEEDDSDDEDDEDSESMDVSDLAFDDDDDDDDDEDDDEEEDEDDDEEDDSDDDVKVASPGSTPMPPAKKAKGNNALANNTPVSSKKKKQQEAQQAKQNESGKKNKGDKQQQQSPQKQAPPLTNGNTTPGSNKKKKNKDNSGTPNSNASTPNNKQQPDGKTPKKSLEGGVIIEDLKVGQGVPAKAGKMVSVYYAGKLKSNNKQFDSTTQGPGFKFRLGKGEVIKGWDVGLNGMKVGGKRRITIPAHMAYGNKGSPPAIPPNSTLVFDVELKNVN